MWRQALSSTMAELATGDPPVQAHQGKEAKWRVSLSDHRCWLIAGSMTDLDAAHASEPFTPVT
jgi:hypothetical protein